MILQRCEWHAAEAIKKKLIKKGYKKERRDKVVDLLWKWIKTADLNLLDMSRANLLLALQDDEKEYLTNYYQPKEPSFCRAYTSKYPNLGCHSTQRNEKIHDVVTVGLSKNIPVGKAIEIIWTESRGSLNGTTIESIRTDWPFLDYLIRYFLSSVVIDLHIIAWHWQW